MGIKTRKHHNNKGYKMIKNGITVKQVKKMAKKVLRRKFVWCYSWSGDGYSFVAKNKEICLSIIEKIKLAGKNLNLLRIVYRKTETGEITDRIVEPYEIRGGYFFGYDTEKNDHIRKFFIVNILQAEILDEAFEPQWPIKIM